MDLNWPKKIKQMEEFSRKILKNNHK